jgi:hypothetical protein
MDFRFSIPGTTSDKYHLERSRNNDTLNVWLTDTSLFSRPQLKTLLTFPFTDSLGVLGYKEDTIVMRFVAPRATRVVKVKRTKFMYETNIGSGFLKPGQKIVFRSQTPFAVPDTSRMKLYDITEASRKKVSYSFSKDSTNLCRYFLNASVILGKKYLFIADSASFSNIYNEYSDSTGIKFGLKDPETYQKLILNITNNTGNHIIQLLNSGEKLVSEVITKKDEKITFPLLDPGKYRVRAIFDLNGDGKWTTGDFETGRQPEPVVYYPVEIELKIGWDLDQEWVMGHENFKDDKLREKKKGN